MPEINRMIMLAIPLIVLQLSLQVYSIVNLIKRKKVRFDNKLIWAAIIILGSMCGSILYLVFRGDEE